MITEFILKIEQWCNLACDYCYMYELADQSWLQRPGAMSRETLKQTASRIGQYAAEQQMPQVRVILHGGEPLLAGPARLGLAAATLRSAIPQTEVILGVQTNGTLLTKPGMLNTLKLHNVRVGVSADGPNHDTHRRYANGRGSYAKVTEGLEALSKPEYAAIYGGLLTVIDVTADPLETYYGLLSHRPPALDFLLPLANHSSAPLMDDPVVYADWLIAIFDVWYAEPDPVRIRLFDELIHLTLNPGDSRTSFTGPLLLPSLVIDSDGSMQMVDALKSAYEGAAETGLNVMKHSVSEAEECQREYAEVMGVTTLSEQCRSCAVVDQCGGGYFPHRWDGVSFLRPSVYCEGLLKLISHIGETVHSELGALI